MSSERSKEKGSRFLYKLFEGIVFIWKTLPFRLFLIVMSVIYLLMITFYVIISPLAHITGNNLFIEYCILIGFYIFFGLFMFIVIELFVFYLVIKNYKLFPEKSQHHYLKYYPPIKAWTIKIHSLLIMGCLAISFLLILLDIFVLNIRTFYVLDIFDEIVPAVLIGFMAFLSLKNTMESFENQNS